MKFLSACGVALLAAQASGAAIKHRLNGFTLTEHPDPAKRELLQKYVCTSQTVALPSTDRSCLGHLG